MDIGDGGRISLFFIFLVRVGVWRCEVLVVIFLMILLEIEHFTNKVYKDSNYH